ncbi:long-chain-fatty-acid--CoA ligase [Actinomadura roseirufa]|uniref:long-chain-fatty-acid--CoA ligase n=1 Tax=Actinomadura roseirufa TaxID=2094049 RepID=UPI0013F16675|nr:long-chain-fatty-acid--CoA ligase [Actinomadura roseirufa]
MKDGIPTTIGRLVSRAAELWPDRVALVEGDARITFAEADRRANQVAHALLSHGIGKGDLVSYLGKSSSDFFFVFWGAAKIGAVFLPFNWRLTPHELSAVTAKMRPALCFAEAEFAGVAAGLEGVGHVLALDAAGPAGTLWEWASGQPDAEPEAEVDPGDVVLVLLTSGTTGVPKGAMLTGDSLIHVRTNQPAGEIWASWDTDEVVVLAMPLFHIGGVALSISGLAYGSKLIVQREFDARELLGNIARHGATRLFIVPSALKILLQVEGIGPGDFTSLKCISYGASPISAELLNECREVFGCGMAQNYGVTESSGAVVVLPPADHVEGGARLSAAGRPLRGVEARAVAPDGRVLPAGELGEITLRARSIMKGYWNDPEATAQAIDADGWLRTGDAGHLDDDGYIYLRARIKDIVISGGENIYPAEIEGALLEHPEVLEAAAFGIPDERWGEVVRAEVVPVPGAVLTEADVREWLRARLASYKIPKTFGFPAGLPRNGAGKILHRVLRAPYWAGGDREVG